MWKLGIQIVQTENHIDRSGGDLMFRGWFVSKLQITLRLIHFQTTIKQLEQMDNEAFYNLQIIYYKMQEKLHISGALPLFGSLGNNLVHVIQTSQ